MTPTTEDVPVFSPGGTYSATVWSNAEGDRGNTQVIVECRSAGTGSGVFALPLPHVPLELRWESETRLVISHPKEIHPRPGNPLARKETLRFAAPGALAALSRSLQSDSPLEPGELLERIKDARRRSEQSAQHLRIVYVEYSGAADVIAALRRRAESAPTPKPVESLLDATYRGRLLATEDGRFLYDYYDAHEDDSLAQDLQERGYQGGGESWAGIVYGLLKLRAPAVLQQISFDPEADGLRLWSSSRGSLTTVAELVTKAHVDPALLNEAIKVAERDSEME